MRCTSPITVGFYSDGKTLCWSPRKYCKEYPTFKIPCGKCISCRLEYARQTAIRCTHEASTWPENCFLTLTYNDQNLGDNKLNYQHIQKFMKGLRNSRFSELLNEMFPSLPQKEQRTQWNQLPQERKKELYEKIQTSVFVAGEYGARTKRAHWHLLIFNWRPKDSSPKYTSERGDKVYTADSLGELWPYGNSEFGDLTFESAGYCARYAAKKLVHGKDQEHEYKPICKRSSKNAIGKRWIEKNWKDCFTNGYLIFHKGNEYIKCGIPRYYEKWLQKYQPEAWTKYVTNVKPKIIELAEKKEEKITLEEKKANMFRAARKGKVISNNQQRNKLLKIKFKELQTKLKI